MATKEQRSATALGAVSAVKNLPDPFALLPKKRNKALSNGRLRRPRLAYEFMQKHARTGAPFSKEELMASTGWSDSSVKTYMTKQYQDFVAVIGDGRYQILPEFQRIATFDDFYALITQKRRVFSQYRRVEYGAVASYEFLLPLTKETELKAALDSLFYTDTIGHRLREIGLTTFERVIQRPNGCSDDDEYVKLICERVGNKFGGYSITHVSGRFRAADLTTRSKAAELMARDVRYLIDETTAVVRFIVPLSSTKHLDEQLAGAFCFIEAPGDDEALKRELLEVRTLFFNLFAEAIVRTVKGEEEIWLVEDTGSSRRLYVWEKSVPDWK